jgi:hypothetical protein
MKEIYNLMEKMLDALKNFDCEDYDYFLSQFENLKNETEDL